MIDVRCFQAASAVSLEAEMSADATVGDLLEYVAQAFGLPQEEPALHYGLVSHDTSRALAPDEKIGDLGDEASGTVVVSVVQYMQGGGPDTAVIAASTLTASKLAIDAAKVGVDAYRARTERMAADLERAKFEAEQGDERPDQHFPE